MVICVTAEFYLYDGYGGRLPILLGGRVEEGDVWSGCLEVLWCCLSVVPGGVGMREVVSLLGDTSCCHLCGAPQSMLRIWKVCLECLMMALCINLPAVLCLALYILDIAGCVHPPPMCCPESGCLQSGHSSGVLGLYMCSLCWLWSVPVLYFRVVVWMLGGMSVRCVRNQLDSSGSQ